MNSTTKKLSLKKETVASLNDFELQNLKGGATFTWHYTCPLGCVEGDDSISVCPTDNP
jgi:natural product precursor